MKVYRIADMEHAQLVDPGRGLRECGKTGLFFADIGLCASYYLVDFWHLPNQRFDLTY